MKQFLVSNAKRHNISYYDKVEIIHDHFGASSSAAKMSDTTTTTSAASLDSSLLLKFSSSPTKSSGVETSSPATHCMRRWGETSMDMPLITRQGSDPSFLTVPKRTISINNSTHSSSTQSSWLTRSSSDSALSLTDVAVNATSITKPVNRNNATWAKIDVTGSPVQASSSQQQEGLDELLHEDHARYLSPRLPARTITPPTDCLSHAGKILNKIKLDMDSSNNATSVQTPLRRAPSPLQAESLRKALGPLAPGAIGSGSSGGKGGGKRRSGPSATTTPRTTTNTPPTTTTTNAKLSPMLYGGVGDSNNGTGRQHHHPRILDDPYFVSSIERGDGDKTATTGNNNSTNKTVRMLTAVNASKLDEVLTNALNLCDSA